MVPAELARRNHLLAALPKEDLNALCSQLQEKPLKLGQSLYESDAKLAHLYFPLDCVISLLHVLEDGSTTEISVVGFEGAVGVSLFMGGNTTPSRGIAQSAGTALTIQANRMYEEFRRGGALQILLLRYTQALITQMAQTAVCNRHHSLHQQLARWLLLSLDRLPSNELKMTQQLIADMLGVRRSGVNEAAANLQAKKIISYSRGRIRVLNRPALERTVCECYFVVRDEYRRLLPFPMLRPSNGGNS